MCGPRLTCFFFNNFIIFTREYTERSCHTNCKYFNPILRSCDSLETENGEQCTYPTYVCRLNEFQPFKNDFVPKLYLDLYKSVYRLFTELLPRLIYACVTSVYHQSFKEIVLDTWTGEVYYFLTVMSR